jgi:hypothetical protein
MTDAKPDINERAVMFIEKIKGISEALVITVDDVAGGLLATLKLKRDGVDSWGWYFEKGEIKKALFTGEEIAKFIAKELSGRGVFSSFLGLINAGDSYAVSLRFLVIAFAVIYFAFSFTGNGANIFVFLVTMAIAAFLISISARIYFSDFRAPDVIPEKDRELLVSIIKDNGKDGLETYIKLSSLYGFTGNITKLGLSGLPLVTVALTVFFTGLAALLWGLSSPSQPEIVANMMDLSKLTLGAFIGSFVQRNVSATNNNVAEGQSNGSSR